ncbi:MAG: heme exporter protein CcmB [Selenomonadaceae bacterium]|nr:heme exporter protein CcmB [Selenomonadaceae bacterium]
MVYSNLREIIIVLKKEILTGARFKGAFLTMLMFSVTTLSLISLILQGAVLESGALSAAFWTIIFFSAGVSVDRLFMEEEFSGTIKLLRIYGAPCAVLFGKTLYGFILLAALSLFTSFLFIAFFDINFTLNTAKMFFANLIVGAAGLATSGAFLVALSASTKVKSGLFPVLMLPITLPILLLSANITSTLFDGGYAEISSLAPIFLYDMILAVVASILFDYVWYEDI